MWKLSNRKSGPRSRYEWLIPSSIWVAKHFCNVLNMLIFLQCDFIFFSFKVRPVWSQAGLSQIVFFKVPFSILWVVTFIESFWNLSKFKEIRQMWLTRVVLSDCSVPSLLGCAPKGHTGPSMGSLQLSKAPVAVSWPRWPLSLTSGDAPGGSEVKQCARKPWQSPVTTTFPPQSHPLLPPAMSTWWEAAARGPWLPECHHELPAHIALQLGRRRRARCCWQLGLLAGAPGTCGDRLY